MEQKKSKEEILAQLKKEHPLVTDERCFRLSWWPDPIPECLKEEEEKN